MLMAAKKTRRLRGKPTSIFPRTWPQPAIQPALAWSISPRTTFSTASAAPTAKGTRLNPLSCYGQLKLESEGILKKMERVLVVRTLWLYGYVPQVGSNFLTWVLNSLSSDQPLRVFADQWGNPTYIRDLARAVVALCRQEARGLFHAGGATFMTRWEMAREIACFFGIDGALIEPVPTCSVALPAKRPLRSGLRTDALEATLGRRPLSFAEGLRHLAADPHFRRDFPQFAH